MTATIWARALLTHEYGLDLRNVRWVQGGTNEPGRLETLPVTLPEGVSVTAEAKRSLGELLVAGEIDAILAPHTPAVFDEPEAGVVRLFSDPAAVEHEYYARTGIFPIMHLVVLREDVHARHPWVAMNLLTALAQAKDRSLARIADSNAPRTPLPWGPSAADAAAKLMGRDLWPFGVEAHRTTLDAFLDYATEQGVCERRLEVDELFAPQTLEAFRI